MNADEIRGITIDALMSDHAIKKQIMSIDRKIKSAAKKGKNYVRISSTGDERSSVIREHYEKSDFVVHSASGHWIDIRW